MKALILNSGMGTRMGDLVRNHPKCMTQLQKGETILSRQLKLLARQGIRDVVITTGKFHEVLMEYCRRLATGLSYTFIHNPVYEQTNYIYSIELAKKYLQQELIFFHGDLVFSEKVLSSAVKTPRSCMAISSTSPLPQKDFKAVVERGCIRRIGTDLFDDAFAAQPLYHLKKEDWLLWLDRMSDFCARGNRTCYAEDAFNEISDQCRLFPLDVKEELCCEVDTPEDLKKVKSMLEKEENR